MGGCNSTEIKDAPKDAPKDAQADAPKDDKGVPHQRPKGEFVDHVETRYALFTIDTPYNLYFDFAARYMRYEQTHAHIEVWRQEEMTANGYPRDMIESHTRQYARQYPAFSSVKGGLKYAWYTKKIDDEKYRTHAVVCYAVSHTGLRSYLWKDYFWSSEYYDPWSWAKTFAMILEMYIGATYATFRVLDMAEASWYWNRIKEDKPIDETDVFAPFSENTSKTFGPETVESEAVDSKTAGPETVAPEGYVCNAI